MITSDYSFHVPFAVAAPGS